MVGHRIPCTVLDRHHGHQTDDIAAFLGPEGDFRVFEGTVLTQHLQHLLPVIFMRNESNGGVKGQQGLFGLETEQLDAGPIDIDEPAFQVAEKNRIFRLLE